MPKPVKNTPHANNTAMYNDSISEWDNYSNPYDYRNVSHPGVIQRRAEQYANSKDKLIPAQRKLEMELMQKYFQKIPQGQFVLGKLGKYGFLAIVLPPYFLLYGLPNWIMMQALPTIFKALKVRGKKLCMALTRPIVNAYNSIANPVRNAILAIKGKIDSAFESLKQFAKKIYDIVTFPGRMINQYIFQPLGKGYETLQGLFKRLSDLGSNFAEILQQQASKRQQDLLNLLQFLKDKAGSAKQMMEKAWKLSASFLNQTGVNINNYVNRILDGAVSIYNRLIKAPSDLASDLRSKAQELASQAYQRMREQASKFSESLLDLAISMFKNSKGMSSAFKRLKKDGLVRGFAREAASISKKAAKLVGRILTEFCVEFVQLIPIPYATLFSPFAKLARSLYKAPKKLYQSGQGALKKIKKIRDNIKAGLSMMRFAFKYFLEILRKAYRKIALVALEYLKKAAAFLVWIAFICVEALKRVAYMIRLLVAWLTIIFRLGMQAVREASNRLWT